MRLVGIWVLGIAAGTTCAAPFVPSDDEQVLERLPWRAGDVGATTLARLRAAADAQPGSAQAAADLAEHYFDLALAQGDPRFVGYAEAALIRYQGEPDARWITTRGVMRQYRHDFPGALQDFERALSMDPSHAPAHAWRAAVRLVQAETALALRDCEALRRLERAALAGGCEGLALAYSGRLDAAGRVLTQALDAARSDEQRSWLFTRLAEVAAWQDRPQVAEQRYRQALALDVESVYLRTAWADFLLDAGRTEEVLRALEGRESSDSLLLRLTEAATALKKPQAERWQRALQDRYAAARARGDTTHLGEEARFELRVRGDAATALRLAQENYATQREPRDARILLESAVAASQRGAAQSAIDWLQRSGFEDRRLRRLAGLPAEPPSKTPGTR